MPPSLLVRALIPPWGPHSSDLISTSLPDKVPAQVPSHGGRGSGPQPVSLGGDVNVQITGGLSLPLRVSSHDKGVMLSLASLCRRSS